MTEIELSISRLSYVSLKFIVIAVVTYTTLTNHVSKYLSTMSAFHG